MAGLRTIEVFESAANFTATVAGWASYRVIFWTPFHETTKFPIIIFSEV